MKPFDGVVPEPELALRAAREREAAGDPMLTATEKILPFVRELAARGGVTAEEWCVPMNSYERRLLVTKLRLSPFIEHVEYVVSQTSPVFWRRPEFPTTYDETLAIDLVPEAFRRLRLLVEERDKLVEERDSAMALYRGMLTGFGEVCFGVEVCDEHDGGSVWYSEEEFIETREEADDVALRLRGKRDNGLARVVEVRRRVVGDVGVYRSGKKGQSE
jgi:hypothetical protein